MLQKMANFKLNKIKYNKIIISGSIISCMGLKFRDYFE